MFLGLLMMTMCPQANRRLYFDKRERYQLWVHSSGFYFGRLAFCWDSPHSPWWGGLVVRGRGWEAGRCPWVFSFLEELIGSFYSFHWVYLRGIKTRSLGHQCQQTCPLSKVEILFSLSLLSSVFSGLLVL